MKICRHWIWEGCEEQTGMIMVGRHMDISILIGHSCNLKDNLKLMLGSESIERNI